jgi:uncharacterized protein (DUF1800 family)
MQDAAEQPDEGKAAPRMGGAEAIERRALQAMGVAMSRDTLRVAIATRQPFAMRLLDFFSNHFSVSGNSAQMRGLAPTLEREAIAPHVGGRFEDMLLAVERHPAMLVYLSNAPSVGPDSRLGQQRGRGLNENLAREILELHTLGVDGGYTQADVRELAMAITGWTVDDGARAEHPGFSFRAAAHQPGARTLLGQHYAEGGVEQGESMLRTLARHPATARHLAFKLARHMVADEPPPALVDTLATRWQQSGGELRAVCEALLDHHEAWAPQPRKLKTPREFVVSSARALGVAGRQGAPLLLGALQSLGQAPFSAGSPAGFGDVADAWDGAEALMTRIDLASRLAALDPRSEPLALAREALGARLGEATTSAIRRAASREQGIALALMSPEFQRR